MWQNVSGCIEECAIGVNWRLGLINIFPCAPTRQEQIDECVTFLERGGGNKGDVSAKTLCKVRARKSRSKEIR